MANISTSLDTIGAVIAIVLGVLLLLGTLSIDQIVGIALLLVGVLALARKL